MTHAASKLMISGLWIRSTRFHAPRNDCVRLTENTMLRLILALCAALFAFNPAHAQDYDLAKAKSEGKVSWYTSTPIEQAQKIVAAFKRATGIEVELFRSGGSAI